MRDVRSARGALGLLLLCLWSGTASANEAPRLGVSWILTGNYRIVSNLIHSKLNGVGNARIIQLRVQVEY